MSGVLFGTLLNSHFTSQRLHLFCLMLDEIYHCACKTFQLVTLHHQNVCEQASAFQRLITNNILYCRLAKKLSLHCFSSVRIFCITCSIARWALIVAFAKVKELLNGLVHFFSVSYSSSISIVFKGLCFATYLRHFPHFFLINLLIFIILSSFL